jgi:hypothetical protein
MKRYAAAKLAALMLSTRSVAKEIDHPSPVGSGRSPMMGRLHSVSARPPRPTSACLLACSSHRPSPFIRPAPPRRIILIAAAGLIHSETQAGPNGFGLGEIRQGRNQDQGSAPLPPPPGSADSRQLAAPKSKYIEHILIATHTGEAGVAEVFRALQSRLRDATWTIVFKGLIVVHLMMREGQEDVTLKYLSLNPRSKLAISNFTEGACPLPHGRMLTDAAQTQGRNIRTYADYLAQRSASYGGTKVDYVRSGEGRLKGLSVDRGLLRETESVQDQLRALFKCDVSLRMPSLAVLTVSSYRTSRRTRLP